MEMPPPPPMVLLEENVVDGLGRFSVYSNGHIRVLFNDRTCLDMVIGLSNRLGSSWQVRLEVRSGTFETSNSPDAVSFSSNL